MNSSFTLNNTVLAYESPSDFSTSSDPTNYDFTNGADSSGLNGPRWTAKLSGMYALPWNMSLAAFYNLRDGLQFNRTILSPNRTGSLGTIATQVAPQGTEHYPTFSQLDLHWDKGFVFGPRRIQLNVDAFNLTNASTVLARQTRQNFAQANYVTSILAPRVIRFGLKVNFLAEVIRRKGSDLLLVAGRGPAVRIDGVLAPVADRVLDGDDIAAAIRRCCRRMRPSSFARPALPMRRCACRGSAAFASTCITSAAAPRRRFACCRRACRRWRS